MLIPLRVRTNIWVQNFNRSALRMQTAGVSLTARKWATLETAKNIFGLKLPSMHNYPVRIIGTCTVWLCASIHGKMLIFSTALGEFDVLALGARRVNGTWKWTRVLAFVNRHIGWSEIPSESGDCLGINRLAEVVPYDCNQPKRVICEP